jgi:hypothetical protein
VVLFSLGSVGKTQVALKIAYGAKETLGWTVIWLSAASHANFQQACTEVVKCFAIPTVDADILQEQLKQYLNSPQAGK